jgi:MFS family permease
MVIGWMIPEVLIGYELYKMTHNSLSLALIGLVEALPYMALVMIGGHFADRYSKKYIILVMMSIVALGALALWALFQPSLHLTHTAKLVGIYVVILGISIARGFSSPAHSSFMSFLVPEKDLGNASTWQSTTWLAGSVIGPALAGFLYVSVGLSQSLWISFCLFGVVVLLGALLPHIPPMPQNEEEPQSMRESLSEGWQFARNNKFIWYSTWLDMVAVLFGGVVAILPIFAEDILHVGAQGLGILRAAPAIGGALTSLILAKYSPLGKAWRNLLLAVAGFGISTLIFAVSQNFWLSVVALFFTGVTDTVSMIIRWTILQMVPPPELRARVISVNSIFISASNELGAFESGTAARLLGTVPSVIFGGVLALGFVTFVWRQSAEMFDVDFTQIDDK